MSIKRLHTIVFVLFLMSYGNNVWAEWNNPYHAQSQKNIYFSAFATQPKTLDPARSYNADEILFIAQIYEPPLQYDYLKRPYQLITLSAAAMPIIHYYDDQGQPLSEKKIQDFSKIAFTTYDIHIQPGIYYQPHPAFARNEQGQLRYAHLKTADWRHIQTLADFKETGTRELTAEDYVYEIKRLADPKLSSPIFGLMSHYLLGLDIFRQQLSERYQHIKRQSKENNFIDLRTIPLACCQVISRYHYRIKIKGFYPQFKYWLTMPFFAPMPWEAVLFYNQPKMAEHNITLDEYPVGTGPYMMQKNNPNSEIVLIKNSNFRGEIYPEKGSVEDSRDGYLQLAGKKMPFMNEFKFSLEKENIPRWQKFLQGYYDRSTISSESFDQAISFNAQGQPELTANMKHQGIYLNTTVNTSDYYLGFNMLDPVVGGYSEKNRLLREAIAIAIDYEEYIAIFLNGRGIVANGPIPPGIFGYQSGKQGLNPDVYNWIDGQAKRKPISDARQLLARAGYPNGIDQTTGKRLVLNYDVASSGGPDESAQFNWLRKQFAKLHIALHIRATLPNRFQNKLRAGDVQIYSMGWNADYPDPENFLFLFYGPNSMVKSDGENTSNYANPQFDQLFLQIAKLPDGVLRQQKIDEMVRILQRDSPWIWGYHPITFVLSQQWVTPLKPSAVANNLLKYYHLDPQKRDELLTEWNKPILWPLFLIIIFIVLLFLILILSYYLRILRPNIKRY